MADPNLKQKLAHLRKFVRYRNEWLEHREDLGRGRGISTDRHGAARISYHHKPTDLEDIETEPAMKLLDNIRDYLVESPGLWIRT
jgi:hypothetical protein